MVSVIVPSYGGFESLGFPSSDHLKYQLGCVPSSTTSVVSAVQSKNLNIHQSNSPIIPITNSNIPYSSHRKRKVLVMDASKGNGGPPILRSPPSSSLYKPLFVDCSVEYELPNVPKVPKNSLPLLVIHPGYEPKNDQHHSESGSPSSSGANNRMARKRDASSLQQPNSNNYINIHSSTHPPHPLYSSSISAAPKGNAYSACCYSVPITPAPMSEALNGSPPSAKRSRPSSEWLCQQRRLCEQQQLKRYQQQQQQHLVSVQQQQQHLWRLNSCPPLIHHSWSGASCCSSNCCPSNKMWLQHQQQQIYAKQQQVQQQQEAYYQQQLLRSGGASGSSSLCPGCISGKCLFVWNKENLSAYR
uniref:Uncharacterized protein n=1 Tax=Lepeophtheirus salmonis TaxID=72036 RepID=A0A0K2TCE5_LEPSM